MPPPAGQVVEWQVQVHRLAVSAVSTWFYFRFGGVLMFLQKERRWIRYIEIQYSETE